MLTKTGLKHYFRYYFLRHPFFIYFFILPVYTPLRILSDDFERYKKIMPDNILRIDYFLLVFFFIGFSGVILTLIQKFVWKDRESDCIKQITYQRTFSLLIAIFLVFSTYFIFFPSSYKSFLFISGAHYFCITYLANLAIVETKHYQLPLKNNSESIVKATNSTLIAFIVNLFGLFFFVILNFVNYFHAVDLYCYMCLASEVFLFFYLLILKGYISTFLIYIKNSKFLRILADTFFLLVAIFLSMLTAYFITIHFLFIMVFIPITLFLAILTSKQLGFVKVLTVFVGTFSYSIGLLIFMSPSLLDLHSSSFGISENYSYLTILEPILGIIFSALLFYLLYKRRLAATHDGYDYVIKGSIVLLVPMLIILFNLKGSYFIINVVLFFVIYSAIETFSQYGVRGIIFNIRTDQNSVFLNYFNIVTLQAFSPAVYLLLLNYFHKDYISTPKIVYSTVFTMSILALLALGFIIAIHSITRIKCKGN